MKKRHTYLMILFLISIINYSYTQDFWEIVPTPDTANPQSITINMNGDIFMGSDGVYLSQDTGETWELKGLLGKPILSIAVDSAGNIFAGTTGKLYKSNDYGNTWDLVLSNVFNVLSIAICNDGLMFAGMPYYIFKSFDYGETWDTCYIFTGWEEYAYDFAYTALNTVYVGTTAFMGNGGGVYRSVDYGNTWEHIGLLNHFIQALSLNPTGDLFAGSVGQYYDYHGGVYLYDISSDWIMLRDDLLVMDISINSDGVLFLGCDWEPGFYGGVYRSYDNGQTWEKIITGLLHNSVHELCLSPDEYLYAITYAPAELFRSTQSTVTAIPMTPQASDYPFVYPNPFIDKITLELSNNAHFKYIQVDIYSLSGNLLGKFNYYEDSLSNLTLNLQRLNLAVGIYCLRFKTERYSKIFKIIKVL